MINEFIEHTIALEGEASDHSYDPGGATMFGLSARHNPSIAEQITHRCLQRSDAIAYIRKMYYENRGLKDIKSSSLAYFCFDSLFVGHESCIIGLQVVLKLMGFKLKVDGILGPETINACNQLDSASEKKVLDAITRFIPLMAEFENSQVIKWQKRHNKKVTSVYNGYVNRMTSRIGYSYTLLKMS